MKPRTLTNETIRHFVLGRQGLWPVRRWSGPAGLDTALHEIGSVQMDPLNVVARAHHIALWGRVDAYAPADLEALMYGQRRFFDYGGVLRIRPMAHLPYWRLHMARRRDEPRWAAFRAENGPLLRDVLREVETDGPLGNRDFTGTGPVTNYRGGKDTTVALYYLWLTGELMIDHRRGFDRVYDVRHRVAPPEHNRISTVRDAERFFARSVLAHHRVMSERAWKNAVAGALLERMDLAEARRQLAGMEAEGIAAPVRVEGQRGLHYVLTDDLPTIEDIATGTVPAAWTPVGVTTDDEVVFLSPLDIVSASGRAAALFDFEYLWEVYKPAHKRRWGHYTLPILWGDRLVARIDSKLDRERNVLRIEGFWLEDDATGNDPAFIAALSRGLRRFARFLGAVEVEADTVGPSGIRRELERVVERED
jgi:uncharacterized protein YcaQ